MPASEEYLAVADLTELTDPTENDRMVMQASGDYGDVMLMSLSNLVTFLQNSFAVLDSPEFTGTPSVPDITDPTADDQQIANTSFVQAVAEGKANSNAPEITGTAKFIDAAPLTVDGDGNEVAVATQTDISNLTAAIQALTDSLNAATADIYDAMAQPIFLTRTVQGDNIPINANSYTAEGARDITIEGYRAVAIRSVGIYNATSSGIHSSWCVPTKVYIYHTSGADKLDYYIWNQNTGAQAKIRFEISILYVKAGMLGS